MRRPLEATRWIRVLEEYAGPPWTAGEVALIGSHLGEGVGGRPRYEVLGLAPLAGG
jgi:2'-5' RNA ligase